MERTPPLLIPSVTATMSASIRAFYLLLAAALLVEPLARMAALLPFTTVWIFTSLTPQTTRPLPFFRSAAALVTRSFSFLLLSDGAAPVVTALYRATAIAPICDGLHVARSSAAAPVIVWLAST